MNSPSGNQAYIYYNENCDFEAAGTEKVIGQDETTHSHHFRGLTDTKITGVRLTANPTLHKITEVTLYKGKGSGATEIVSVSDTADKFSIILSFEPTAFGSVDSELLKIVLVTQDGNDMMLGVEFYESIIVFPDGFFDKIVPSRTDRGGGVIELADGTLVQYKGYGGNRWRWKLGAKFVEKPLLDQLDALYAERSEFVFAQEPDRYPHRVYRCILETPVFRIPYTTQWKGNGYSIEMDIAQV